MPLRRPASVRPPGTGPGSGPGTGPGRVVAAVLASVLLPGLLAGCSALDGALEVGDADASLEAPAQAARLGDAWPPVGAAQVAVTLLPEDPGTRLRAVVLAPGGRCGLGVDGFRLDTGAPTEPPVDRLRRVQQVQLVSAAGTVPGTAAPAVLTTTWGEAIEALRGATTLVVEGELVVDPDGQRATFTASRATGPGSTAPGSTAPGSTAPGSASDDGTALDATVRCTPS